MSRLTHNHSDTAEATATMRAAESLLPEGRRLLVDPMARHFVRRPAYLVPARSAFAARLAVSLFDRWCPGLHGHVVLRARYADDAIRSTARAGVRQVVLLGAGFDTTAHRLPGAARFFEVDVPTTQQAKRDRLRATAGPTGSGRTPGGPHGSTIVDEAGGPTYVPCNFGVDDVGARLREHDFDPGAPALFLWLGVVPYLTPEALETTLAELRGVTARGSSLVLDYVEADALDRAAGHSGARRVERMVARRGSPCTAPSRPTRSPRHCPGTG
ncbi:class I SAM-dependent methyltransferase [Micromonospora zhanjiangensis]